MKGETVMIFINRNSFVKEFLVESGLFTEDEAVSLSEDAKDATVSSVASSVISDIMDKTNDIAGTLIIDKSRGDIRHFQDLQALQNAVTKLESLLENVDSSNTSIEEAKHIVREVIKTLMYLNQYRDVFRAAYASKKTVLMLKYKELMIAAYTTVGYLISAIVDFKNAIPGLKENFRIENISVIKALQDFNKSVDNGQFKTMVKDTMIVREAYVEFPISELSTITEAEDIVGTITSGLKNFVNNLDQGGRFSSILYKAVGILVLLISMREVYYTVCRTRYKFADVIENVKQFAGFDTHKISDSFKTFANRFAADVETASTIASREVSDRNRDVASEIKALPPSGFSVQTQSFSTPSSNTGDSFSFGF